MKILDGSLFLFFAFNEQAAILRVRFHPVTRTLFLPTMGQTESTPAPPMAISPPGVTAPPIEAVVAQKKLAEALAKTEDGSTSSVGRHSEEESTQPKLLSLFTAPEPDTSKVVWQRRYTAGGVMFSPPPSTTS